LKERGEVFEVVLIDEKGETKTLNILNVIPYATFHGWVSLYEIKLRISFDFSMLNTSQN
jgi:hypothetical protein